MVMAYSKIFGNLKPVFDGRKNLYTRDPIPIGNDRVSLRLTFLMVDIFCVNLISHLWMAQVELEVTLPGEGKDRVFHVAVKAIGQVSLFALEEALEGRSRQIPFDTIQALDVVMRHLPSMKYDPSFSQPVAKVYSLF